jgi:hypothetical protein
MASSPENVEPVLAFEREVGLAREKILLFDLAAPLCVLCG